MLHASMQSPSTPHHQWRIAMNKSKFSRRAAMLLAALLAAGPTLAEKPGWAGKGGKDKGPDKGEARVKISIGSHFGDRERSAVRDYYTRETRGGHCPPGLAKKNNGCMPPGQAKKWQLGQVLPRDVIYYDLSPRLSVEIGVPPPGYKFVRVASDILMIAVGTGLVVDAINDLGRL
jgi:Ni/Co efflux regulator RcnB